MKTSLEELLEGMAADAAAEPRSRPRPPPPPIPAAALDSLDDGPVLVGPLVPSALPRSARRGPPPPPARRKARGTEPAAGEHSGLIDMRAMAQSYLAEQAPERPAHAAPLVVELIPVPLAETIAPAAEPAAEPVSEPVSEPAADSPAPAPIVAEGTGPVPQVEPKPAAKGKDTTPEAEAKSDRPALVWPRIAGIAALVIALFAGTVALTAMLVRGGSDGPPEEEEAGEELAALPSVEREAPPPAPPAAEIPAPEPDVADVAVASDIAFDETVEPAPAVASPEPAVLPVAETAPARAVAVALPAPAAQPPATLFEEENGCYDPACATTAPVEVEQSPPAQARKRAPKQPTYYRQSITTRPSSSEIASAVVAVQDQLDGCGDAFGTRGTVPLTMRVAPSGAITSVTVKQGTTKFRSCVSSAVRRAKLAPTELGTTASFSILVR